MLPPASLIRREVDGVLSCVEGRYAFYSLWGICFMWLFVDALHFSSDECSPCSRRGQLFVLCISVLDMSHLHSLGGVCALLCDVRYP